MSEFVQAVYEDGVLRPLVPLDLREHELVSLSIVKAAAPQTGDAVERMSAEGKQGIVALLDQVERMPQKSPADDFSQRDHDQIIYGLSNSSHGRAGRERLIGFATKYLRPISTCDRR